MRDFVKRVRKRRLRVLAIFGTRPEAIKMAPVVKELRRYPDRCQTAVCVTAQHRDMLDQVLALFNIEPDYDLNIMGEGQSLSMVTNRVLSGVEGVIVRERPDWVLVQGDTTTAMATALEAFYQQVKVAHIEAGLRTRDKFHPYPEEMNRVIIDNLSDLRFAPTEHARLNLLQEGCGPRTVLVTGNTVIDALLDVAAREEPGNPASWLGIPRNRKVLLVTAHRRENFGEPLSRICASLKAIAGRWRDVVYIIYPVHRNPNVWRPVHEALGEMDNILLLEPLEYPSFVRLMKQSYLILTDSGGVQEEAPSLGKPVLVLREVTERPEAVAAGTVRLVGTKTHDIVSAVSELLTDPVAYERMARAVNPYGDGHASERIVSALLGEKN